MSVKERLRAARDAGAILRAVERVLRSARINIGVMGKNAETGQKKGISVSPTESQAIRLASLEEKLTAYRDEWMDKTEDAVRLATDSRLSPREQAAMMAYYVAGETWEQTAVLVGVDTRTIYRIHGRALRKLSGA